MNFFAIAIALLTLSSDVLAMELSPHTKDRSPHTECTIVKALLSNYYQHCMSTESAQDQANYMPHELVATIFAKASAVTWQACSLGLTNINQAYQCSWRGSTRNVVPENLYSMKTVQYTYPNSIPMLHIGNSLLLHHAQKQRVTYKEANEMEYKDFLFDIAISKGFLEQLKTVHASKVIVPWFASDGPNTHGTSLLTLCAHKNTRSYDFFLLHSQVPAKDRALNIKEPVYFALRRGNVSAIALDYWSNTVAVCTKNSARTYAIHIDRFNDTVTDLLRYPKPIQSWHADAPARMKKCSFITPHTGIALSNAQQLYVFASNDDGTVSWYVQKMFDRDRNLMPIISYALNYKNPRYVVLLSDRGTFYLTDLTKLQCTPSSASYFPLITIGALPDDVPSAAVKHMWYAGNHYGYSVPRNGNLFDNISTYAVTILDQKLLST